MLLKADAVVVKARVKGVSMNRKSAKDDLAPARKRARPAVVELWKGGGGELKMKLGLKGEGVVRKSQRRASSRLVTQVVRRLDCSGV